MLYKISSAFRNFVKGQQFSGFLLLLCACVSLIAANVWDSYSIFWDKPWFTFDGHVVTAHWVINEVLMTFFFLWVGIEIKREFTIGELNTVKKAALPIVGALGGMLMPALLFYLFAHGTKYIKGWAIPTATDIAFALTALKLAGNKIPFYIKIILTSLAVADDLGAIILISVFYSNHLNAIYISALTVYMIVAYYSLKKVKTSLYIFSVSLLVIWLLLLKSGIHPSIAGVLLAFALPQKKASFAEATEHFLNKPINYWIMPLFALANSAISIQFSDLETVISSPLALGIVIGLCVGKPLGIFLFTVTAKQLKIVELPEKLNKYGIATIGIFAGIGFTMSLFVSIMAFENDNVTKKLAIFSVMVSSLLVGLFGLIFVKWIPSSKLSK